ncbi:MAG: ABC transporter ATP-binding protein [Propionibacteriaceae bacterium]|jgi:ABC-type lipoprotein export system ATPase subunit|nr:ABC transporter ATP-binding protein [Propionibacteriaceae bacterium]
MQVKLDNIGHSFSGQPFLFRHLSLTLEPHRVYALVGPSGSGKSTLLSILTGWLDPTEGAVEYEGINRVGWVFQNPHGVAHRSAIDHVVLPLLARGLFRSDAVHRAKQLLNDFGLSSATYREFCELSGGEAQRLMLARGIAARPHLLLVDEPTAQLDIQTAQTVDACLGALIQRTTIVVIATHATSTREACSDIINLEKYT